MKKRSRIPKRKFEDYMVIVEECCVKLNLSYTPTLEVELRANLQMINEYIDIVLDAFLTFGLDSAYEPTKYGMLLDETLSYFVRMSWDIS